MNDRPAWLEWRRQGIGASEAAVACGMIVHGRDRPQLWGIKTGRLTDTEQTDRMRWGILLEPLIVDEFVRTTGLYVFGEQAWCTHPVYPHHRCTVDGFVADHPTTNVEDALGVIELKTGQDRWDDIPDHYTCQVQWQLHVTGMAQAWVAYLRAGYDFTVHEIERDDDLIARLVDGVEQFWNSYVIPDEQPPYTPATPFADLYPQPVGDTVELDDTAQAWYDRAVILRDTIGPLTKELEQCRQGLRDALRDHDTGVIGGQIACTWKPRLTIGVDIDALERDHPDLADKYRKVTSTRTLLIKDLR